MKEQRRDSGNAPRHRAFTVLELLVAMTVLSIIVVLLAQVFAGVASSTGASAARVQESSDVRNAMDRIGFDIQGMIWQGNVTPIFNSNTYNGASSGYDDVIAFLSNVRAMNGTETNTRMAAICYSIETTKTGLSTAEASTLGAQPMLTRWNRPYEWEDDTAGTKDLTAFTPNKATTGVATAVMQNGATGTSYQVLNPNIFRMEIYFQLQNGTLSSTVPLVTTTSTPAGGGAPVSTMVANWSIVQSIHIAFAVLDHNTRLKMTTAQLQTLFGDPAQNKPPLLSDFVASSYTAASSTTPMKIWTDQLATAATSIGFPAAKALHFYERSYDLH